jgi:hypothetical protein
MGDYCRIFGIMARKAPICALFRRGASKWVQLVKWNTDTDSFEAGHWFHGRIYERRSDLSPNGTFLIYFASKFTDKTLADAEGYTYAWTAISRLPYYEAIVLWPKGDCWCGGGLFETNRRVWLNHEPEAAQVHPRHASPFFIVEPNPQAHGEDHPVYSKRLQRDGWKCVQEGKFSHAGSGWDTERTEIWERSCRDGKRLRRELLKIDFEAYGGPYVEEFSVIPKNGSPLVIPEADWADLDQKEKLVFARFGKVFRGALIGNRIEEKELIDLNKNEPPTGRRH